MARSTAFGALIAYAVAIIGLLCIPVRVPTADGFVTPARSAVASTKVQQGVTIRQEFRATGNQLGVIALQLATYQRTNAGTLTVAIEVRRDNRWQRLATQTKAKEQLIDNALQPFQFPTVLSVRAEELLAIELSGDGGAIDGISWWYDPTLTYPGAQLYVNGQPTAGMAVFLATYSTNRLPLIAVLPQFWSRITIFLNPLWQTILLLAILLVAATPAYTLGKHALRSTQPVHLRLPAPLTIMPEQLSEEIVNRPSIAESPSLIGPGIAPIIAAIPAYNEARFIGSIVLQVRRYVDIVLVIDDGSRDQTAAIAEAAGATVLRHEQNRGKGQGVNTAFAEARRLGARCLVLIDGDGQHEASEIPLVIAPILANEADMTVGSRFLTTRSEIPAYRKVGQHGLTLATNLSSGVSVTDSQSGFRAFSPAAIEALTFSGTGFSIESEMQFLAREHKLKVTEVPISVIYEEPAKRNPITHGLAVLNGIIRLVSQGRPLFFFGVPGMFLIMLGGLLGIRIVFIYQETQILAIGYTLIVLLLMTVGILSIFTGIILYSIRVLLNDLEKARRSA
jgi:glycosyltransferase involved in cell wall biosynthesis